VVASVCPLLAPEVPADVPLGLRVFVIGLELWYHLQTYWFRGNFRLQAAGIVLLLYWVLGCLVVFTREKSKEPMGLEQAPARAEEIQCPG
jgi:hypothetical protein